MYVEHDIDNQSLGLRLGKARVPRARVYSFIRIESQLIAAEAQM